ncbi:MAG TPA: glucuronosyltransferase [Devosiaceae bacterium]|nr:glucuronosyltransferase [Devosiaceae bacterium]
MQRILAISSGGGHWEQLMIVSAAFEADHVTYATTIESLAERTGKTATIVNDCNRDRPLASLKCLWDTFALVWRTKPAVVVSTGAAPGLFAIFFGKLLGARTIWIDSVANCEQLSMSGKIAGKMADLWLTQWKHLESANGPRYLGSVL